MENISQEQVGELITKETQEEAELLKEPQQDTVKTSIATKFGLVEGVDDELIEKLTADHLDNSKKMSTVIKQKISWREKANAQIEQKKKEEVQTVVASKVEDIDKIVSAKVMEQLEQNELDSLNLSDELKKELKNYAKVSGKSIKNASNSDYFTFLKDKEQNKDKVDKASIGTQRRASSGKDFSNVSPNDFDLSTKEGKEQWKEYKSWLNNR